jgi:hypothetical protein
MSANQEATEDGGCGCRLIASPNRASDYGLGFGLLLLLGLRRRRIRRIPPPLHHFDARRG